MNLILANIYGTHGGLEKVAEELPPGMSSDDLPSDLSELALMIVADDDTGDIEKTAAAHEDVLGRLIEFDRAGRTIAQAEFSEMEKAAAEGDPSALDAFFTDADEGTPETEQRAMAAEAIKAELRRRGVNR